MKSPLMGSFLVLMGLVILIFVATFLFPRGTSKKDQFEYFSVQTYAVSSQPLECKAMVDDYCDNLYSDTSQGNLKVFDGKNEYLTLQGQTNNNFENPWFFFYSARLENQKLLPADLKEALDKRSFFIKLKNVLKRPSKQNMQLEQNIAYVDLESEVDQIWLNSFDEVVIKRLEKKFPGTFRLSEEDLPQDIVFEKVRVKKKLWSEISKSLWSRSENWLKVQKDFKALKEAFKKTIKKLSMDQALKNQWLAKLEKIKLALPGENPITANSDCISVSRNAYYYPYLNTLTVCAGYFNGGEQIQTLSHELSHAFDLSSHMIDFQQASDFTKNLRGLKKKICSHQKFNCMDWKNYLSQFQDDLRKLTQYEVPLRQFHQCLQRKPVRNSLSEEILQAKAEELIKNRISDLTLNSSFLRITSLQLPMPNGRRLSNPNYLNPCEYSVWGQDPFALDSDLISLIYFTAAFLCEDVEAQARIKNAVAVSKDLSTSLFKVLLQQEGEFSPRPELLNEGYSSPSSERFADRMGSYNVAEYLSQFGSVAEKRGRYLVSSFWLCDKPSLKKSNLQVLSSLSDYIFDRSSHSENDDRLKDWLSLQVREQLQCEKDFESQDCDL